MMMNNRPEWLVEERAIVDPQARHEWMCKQLIHRRNAQSSRNIEGFYKEVLSSLFKVDADDGVQMEMPTPKIIEVLSDGLGYVEPHWHGISLDQNSLAVLSEQTAASYKRRVARFRKNHRTHRMVGKELYQSALFAVSAEGVWVLSVIGKSENWQPLEGEAASDLPTKFNPNERERLEPGDFGTVLKTLACNVLWPAFFATQARGHGQNLSLVLLHTSLWHDAAGVWNLHAHFPGIQRISPKELSEVSQLNALTALAGPPVRCLEDVADWAYAREGYHRRRRANVNFAYHGLGQTPPHWNEDGMMCSVEDRDRNALIYEMSPQLPPWVSTPEILKIACSDRSCSCRHWKAIATAFTTARLVHELRDDDHRGAEGVPSTVQLYAEQLLEYVGQAPLGDSRLDGMQSLTRAVQELRKVSDCCDLCDSLIENLLSYWESVKSGTAKG